jgi:methylenetetrahydrofolate reductase (NADPH)
MPVGSVRQKIKYLPEGSRVAVTASPNQKLENTISLSMELSEKYSTIPHITARQVQDEEHLEEIENRLKKSGINDMFIIGGDVENPYGDFSSSIEILELLDKEFTVGIGGYPEGHHIFDDNLKILQEKLPYADYVSTQLCYNPSKIVSWTEEVESMDSSVDILVGVPGVIKYDELGDISDRIGVGESRKLLENREGNFYPDELVEDILSDDVAYGIHVNTFNYLEESVRWVRDNTQLDMESFLE